MVPSKTATSPTGRWKVRACALTAGMHRWRVRALSRRSVQAQMRGPAQPLRAWKMPRAWLGAGPRTPRVFNTLTPHSTLPSALAAAEQDLQLKANTFLPKRNAKGLIVT